METLGRERTSHYAVATPSYILEQQHLIDEVLENGQPSENPLHFDEDSYKTQGKSDLTLFG